MNILGNWLIIYCWTSTPA